MKLKQKIHSHFLQLATDKVQLLQKRLNDLKESGANETKSTAGDKHETALAMVQIEQANIRQQLEEALAQKAILEKINPQITTEKIINRSLVKTNKGYFYVSVALGKAIVDGVQIFAVSEFSPLGKKMLGLKVGEQIQLNEQVYIIELVQ